MTVGCVKQVQNNEVFKMPSKIGRSRLREVAAHEGSTVLRFC